MNEIIKVTTIDGDQLVSGRELHKFLEIKTDFKDWMPRMIEYGFEENVDFSTFWSEPKNELAVEYLGSPQKMSAKGYKKEYILKIDMAKEISMLQKNEKGKEARKYFIECEKIAKQGIIKRDSYEIEDRVERAKAWIEEEEKRRRLEQITIEQQQVIKEQAPKVISFDNALQIDDTRKKEAIKNNLSQSLSVKINNGRLLEVFKHIGWLTPTGKASEEGKQFIYDVIPETYISTSGKEKSSLTEVYKVGALEELLIALDDNLTKAYLSASKNASIKLIEESDALDHIKERLKATVTRKKDRTAECMLALSEEQ